MSTGSVPTRCAYFNVRIYIKKLYKCTNNTTQHFYGKIFCNGKCRRFVISLKCFLASEQLTNKTNQSINESVRNESNQRGCVSQAQQPARLHSAPHGSTRPERKAGAVPRSASFHTNLLLMKPYVTVIR